MPKPCNLKTAKTPKSESCSTPYELFTADHLEDDGPTIFEHVCKLGLEGIVSKRIDLPPYEPGPSVDTNRACISNSTGLNT